MEKNKVHIGIAVALALAFFFMFFGRVLFPTNPILRYYAISIFGRRVAEKPAVIQQATVQAPEDAREEEISLAENQRDSQERLVESQQVTIQPTESGDSEPYDILPGLVRVRDVKEGNGLLAEEGKTVGIKYRLVIEDSETGDFSLVDENHSRDGLFEFKVVPAGSQGSVIIGMNIGIQGMREGGVRVLEIQPELGYGENQSGPIPPNTVLNFEVELHEVK